MNAPLVLRLKGTQQQMGAQYGEILSQVGGFKDLFDFYPRMAESLLVGGLPRRARKAPARFLAANLMKSALGSLAKYRNEEYAKRQAALLDAAKLPKTGINQLFIMDVFQNSIGVLGRLGALHVNERAWLNAIPACTSAAVWNAYSKDGELMHARNFDFPGVSVWDKNPTLVYCTPDKGIPYGYIGARGADVPGITAFNAEGLSVAFHTRFHRDVDFKSLGVIDLGHEIIQKSRTIADAIELVASQRIASTWGIIVTSAKEKNAALIETTAKKCRVTWAKDGHLAQTNHYIHPDLQEGEIATNGGWTAYTKDRLRLAQSFFTSVKQRGGATVQDMQNFLGSDYEIDSPHISRVAGSLVGHVMSVQSVVFKLQSGIISLSIGEAPTGFGPYIEHQIDWSGNTAEVIGIEKIAKSEVSAPYRLGKKYEAYKNFQNAYLQEFQGAPVETVYASIERARTVAKDDPSLAFISGVLSLEQNNFSVALEHFTNALAIEGSPFHIAQNLLWASRAADAMGSKKEATELRNRLNQIQHESVENLKRQAEKDTRRLFPRRDFSDVVVNFAILDAA
ncbi:MAG: hypothetical protein LDLANPLL_00478 [Turneriella sp.]|nr:hypothetical protein [Turneriella sp.]